MDSWMQRFGLRSPALGLLLATVAFWSLYNRFEPEGLVLLNAPTRDDAQRVSGLVSETNGHFVLNVPEGGKYADVRFRFSHITNYAYLRVRARVKIDDVVAGSEAWHLARVVLSQYDAGGNPVPGDHIVMSGIGSRAWKNYETVFRILDGATYAELGLQQVGGRGTAEFQQVEVQPTRLRTSFPWWRILFTLLWLGAGYVYFLRCRLHQRRLRILIFLNALAILVGSLVPGDWIDYTTDQFKEVASRIMKPAEPPPPVSPPPDLPEPPVKPLPPPVKVDDVQEQKKRLDAILGDGHQMGHFALFGSLCILVYLSVALERKQANYFALVALNVLLFAAVTEALQFLTLDRSVDVRDLLVDIYGMIAATLLFLVVLPLVRWGQRRVAQVSRPAGEGDSCPPGKGF